VVGDGVDDEQAERLHRLAELLERPDVEGKVDVLGDVEAAFDVGSGGDETRLEVDLG
jgi:hypothetical protein